MISTFELSGRIAAVTGASSGIGRACALALASAGARVVLVARREKNLREAATEIEAAGGESGWITADLSQYHRIDEPARKISEVFGEPDDG